MISLRIVSAALIGVLLVACQTRPEIRTQSAPELDVARYSTFGFLDNVGTDPHGYTTLTTRYLKEAVTREMQARGYTQAEKPDLLINFNVATQDKVESRAGPHMGVGWGYWRRGYAWGVGVSDDLIRNYTEGSLTIDVVDRETNELIWTGTAVGRLTDAVRENPKPAIDEAVNLIFQRYPKPRAGETAPAK